MLSTAMLYLLSVVALPSLHLSPAMATRLAVLVLASVAALSYHASSDLLSLSTGVPLYGGLFEATPMSYTVDVLLGLLGAMALTPWSPLSRVVTMPGMMGPGGNSTTVFTLLPAHPYYPLLGVLSVTGGSLLASSTSLMGVYLALELQSFGVYVLASLYRDSQSATSAGLTYFLLGGLSSCLILLGAAQLYTCLGVADLEQAYVLLSVGPSHIVSLMALSLTLLASGLAFKIAAAPFHQWAPDVYDRVPTIITLWLQTVPKVAVIGLLLSLTGGLVTNPLSVIVYGWPVWTGVLTLIALSSLVVGSVVGLSQVRIKRLLAYSTISHVGFMVLIMTVYSTEGVSSMVFYLVQYSLTSLVALMVVLAIGYDTVTSPKVHGADLDLLTELRGMVTNSPMLSLGLAASLFSMAGVPPFIGFYAKIGVLEGTLTGGLGCALVAIVASVVSAVYYLKVVRLMYFEGGTDTVSVPVSVPVTMTLPTSSTAPSTSYLTGVHTFIIATLVLYGSLYPLMPYPTLLDSTTALAVAHTLA